MKSETQLKVISTRLPMSLANALEAYRSKRSRQTGRRCTMQTVFAEALEGRLRAAGFSGEPDA